MVNMSVREHVVKFSRYSNVDNMKLISIYYNPSLHFLLSGNSFCVRENNLTKKKVFLIFGQPTKYLKKKEEN